MNPLYYCANELNQYDATDYDPCCPSPEEGFAYDADGNLTEDGTHRYKWNAENRLIRVRPLTPQAGDKRLDFKYDHLGRRVEKAVYTYDGSDWSDPNDPNNTTITRFVYYNWLLLAELEIKPSGGIWSVGDGASTATHTASVLRKYSWGLDLAGQAGQVNSLEGAGGIGGLVGLRDVAGSSSYIYFCDGNGNVVQVIKRSDDSIAARYEYDAYGNNLLDASDSFESGPYADDNPFRFSTKYYDGENENPATAVNEGTYSYIFRDYWPRLGRWGSEDPLSELAARDTVLRTLIRRRLGLEDQIHRFRYVANRPTYSVDYLGLTTISVSGIDGGNLSCRLLEEPTNYVRLCGLDQLPKSSQFGSNVTGGSVATSCDAKGHLENDARRNCPKVEKALRGKCCCGQRSIGVVMIAPKTTHAPKIDCKCCRLTFYIFYDHEDLVVNGSTDLGDPGNTMFGNDFWKNNFTSGECVSGSVYDVDFPDCMSHGTSVAKGTRPADVRRHGTNTRVDICKAIAALERDHSDVIVCHSQGCNITMHALNNICNPE